MACTFELQDDRQLADESLDIVLRGLPVTSEIELQLTLSHYYCINAPMTLDKNTVWSSSALFLTDSKGQIILSQSPALKGSYQGINAMGLFEKAKPQEKRKSRLLRRLQDLPLYDQFDCRLAAFKKGKFLGDLKWTRFYLQKGLSAESVSLKYGKARLFYQRNWQNRPAIIVLSGSEGGLEKAQNIAQLLASRGFVTMALAYFGLEGLPANLYRIPLEIVEEALLHLKALPFVDPHRLGLYGRSKGAELALLAACHFPNIQALVLNAPTDCIYEGLRGHLNAGHSSWTYKGEELTYTKFHLGPFLAQRFFNNRSLNKNPASRLPVQKLSAPTLFIASLQDEVWDAYGSIMSLKSQLRTDTRHRFLLTPYLGHMNTISHQPHLRYQKIPYERLQADTKMSWQATLAHFQENLFL